MPHRSRLAISRRTPRRRARRISHVHVICTTLVLVLAGCVAIDPESMATPTPVPLLPVALNDAQHIEASFYSEKLRRTMPYSIYLPPGYDASSRTYPVLYMLHGLSGVHSEWLSYNLFGEAERLMRGTVSPYIIVLPQGDDAYWVDHADGPAWGYYTAVEVVAEIDARYRTIQSPASRAIGGLSMGADGALQLALNYPGVFGVVGAHSPVLRAREIAADFYGSQAYFGEHYPVTMYQERAEEARRLVLSLDAGELDIWLSNAEAFHRELDGLGIAHFWSSSPGNHDAAYWTQQVPNYITFYGSSLTQS